MVYDFVLETFQENKISFWSVGDFGGLNSNEEYNGEPYLLCDIQHNGDVMDMEVSVLSNDTWVTARNIFSYLKTCKEFQLSIGNKDFNLSCLGNMNLGLWYNLFN